jgi:hypothetical protein
VTHTAEITDRDAPPVAPLSYVDRAARMSCGVREVDAKAFHRRQRALVQASVLLRPSAPRSRFDRAG